MRRLLSYITLSAAMLVGTCVATSPTIINMNTDAAYRDGKTFTFRISRGDVYNGDNLMDYDPSDNTLALSADDTDSIEFVVEEFKKRLDNWGLSSYEINTLGNDTVKVTLRANNNNAIEYAYVEKYLCFSGTNFELDASIHNEDFAVCDSYSSCLDYSNAWIEYIEQGGVPSFPVVVVPLSDPTGQYSDEQIKTDFFSLIDYCDKNTTEGDSEAQTQGTTCSLVIWANKHTDDLFENYQSDINVASRILTAEATGNDNAVWYKDDDDKENKENPHLQIVPSSEALSEGSYDASKADQAYSAARYILNCLQASKYEYKIGGNTVDLSITYLYEETAEASVENLFSYGWNRSVAFKSTLIASLIAIAVAAIVLVIFDKMLALEVVSISVLSIYLTLLAFIKFGAQFNVAAILGLALVGLISTACGICYVGRIKDEIYKGRTVKKAHQEATKKATVFSIDISIVSIILGVFLFFFAGDVVAKAGTMLVVGGFITLVIYNLFQRILGWMISTDSEAQVKFPKWFGINKKEIPDLLKEEKQTYFGPYENRKFSKGRFVSLISTLLLIGGGIASMIIAANKNNGNVFNDEAYTVGQTVLTVEVKSTDKTINDNVALDAIEDFIEYKEDESVNTNADVILNNIYYGEDQLSKHVVSIDLTENPTVFYNSVDDDSSYYYYFTIVLDGSYSLTEELFSSTPTGTKTTLQNIFNEAIDANDFIASAKELKPITSSPYIGKVYLAIGLGIAVSTVYLIIRFGFGKGLTAGILAAEASYASTSVFTIARISTIPMVALGACVGPILVILFALNQFIKTNEIVKESRDKDKETLAFKLSQVEKGANRSALDSIILALVAAYVLISFFAFGPSIYSTVYLNGLIGLVLAIALSLTAIAPVSVRLCMFFSKINIKLPERKKKKLGQLQSNKNSSEPEEAIFIGIND